MKPIGIRLRSVCLLALLLNGLSLGPVGAEPGPGDVFREYLWQPWFTGGTWQRVTDPQARHAGAAEFLPNPVNRVSIDDLEGAVGAEVYIEQWGGHAGTSDKRLRLNGGAWINIPEPAGIPGGAGADERPECYQYLTHVAVPLPLESLLPGENTFEFSAGPQVCHSFGWGQWGVYGLAFRVYYDSETKAHQRGRVVGPASGGENPVFAVEVDDPAQVQRVDLVGRYEDFDIEGNGLYRQWHYTYRYGAIRNHIGSAASAPYETEWDTEWVPDQDQPVEVMGRVLSDDGLYYMTPATEFRLLRPDHSIKLYKPYDVPTAWQTRAGRRHSCELYVFHDLRRATAARLLLSTWSGGHADAIGITHNYSHDRIPLDPALLHPGPNEAFTYAETDAHGIEVLWPGIALKVAYDQPLTTPERGDLRIYGDGLENGWAAAGPPATARLSDTIIDLGQGREVFEGDAALAIEGPQQAWQLRLRTDIPVVLPGYRALRFAVLPRPQTASALTRLDLFFDGRQISLRLEDLPGGVDLQRPEWQVVEIPLEALQPRRPYLTELHFVGLFRGEVLLDDIRLVAEDAPTAVQEAPVSAPAGVTLAQNYPNPFNGRTRIDFALQRSGRVRLEVFNLSGQRLALLADGGFAPGRHTVAWEGRDGGGRPVASGVYLYRLSTPQGKKTRRLLLLR